jgi:hypothetical protein
MRTTLATILSLAILLSLTPVSCFAQTNALADPLQQRLKALEESLEFMEHRLAKRVDDLMWFQRLSDIAEVEKIRYTGPPLHVTNNPTGQGAGNELVIAAYAIMPKKHLR